MQMQRVVDILRTEKECVERQGTPKCPNRECGKCDLLLPTEEVLQAYTLAIGCIEGILTEPCWIPCEECEEISGCPDAVRYDGCEHGLKKL